MVQATRYTLDEFEALIKLPENVDRRFEYIEGDIVEVVSNNYCSIVAARILIELGGYVKKHKLGYVTGADGGYVVAGECYIPAVGFISAARQLKPSYDAYDPNPPDLAVEVLSPTDRPADMRIKLIKYLAAGTTVWVVDPDLKQVEIYTPGLTVIPIGLEDVLDGGDVLPGFHMSVSEIFPD